MAPTVSGKTDSIDDPQRFTRFELACYGDGQQIRDWLYVEDHCEAIWRVIEEGQPGETYNIGGNNQPANLTVVQTLCEILDELEPNSAYIPHNSLIQYVADRPGHDRRYAMDISKIRNEIGWKPRQSIESGLMMTVKWYLDHPIWVEAIHKHHDYQGWLQKNMRIEEGQHERHHPGRWARHAVISFDNWRQQTAPPGVR